MPLRHRLFAAFLGVACFSTTLSAAAPSAPNILLILADDLGYSDLGCYGGEILTRNLDRLAQGGLRFSQFYNTARCARTRAALLTGYYPQQIRRDGFGARGSSPRSARPAWAPLLSAKLRPLGYRSYHSGKWHIDGTPLENGFDRSYNLEDFDRHFTARKHSEGDQPLPPYTGRPEQYTTVAIANHVIKYLQEHAEKHPQQPFFGYVAFNVPHFPLQALDGDIARYRGRYNQGWDALRAARWQRLQQLGLGGANLSEVERDVGPPYDFPTALTKLGSSEINRPMPWTELTRAQQAFQSAKMAIHAAMIDRMDKEIGRILEQISAMGALENTLILFLSDNGASAEIMVRGDGHNPEAPLGSSESYLCLGPGFSSAANTPFRRHKTWVHEGGISTPFIAHWPKGIAARGELRHAPAHVIDIVPTLLEVAGAKPSSTADHAGPPSPGHSLAKLFAHDGKLERDTIWFMHEGNRALRKGDLKIVAAGLEGSWELYDLASDRAEMQNLVANNPAQLAELVQRWTEQAAEFKRWAEKDLPPITPAPKSARKKKK